MISGEVCDENEAYCQFVLRRRISENINMAYRMYYEHVFMVGCLRKQVSFVVVCVCCSVLHNVQLI